MDSARVVELLSPGGDIPANEAQARELVPLLRLEDGEQAIVEVMRELRDTYGVKPSAPLIRHCVLKHYDRERGVHRRPGQRISRPVGERWRELRMASVGNTRLAYIHEAITEASELMGTGLRPLERRDIARESLPQLRNLLADVERWAGEGRESS